MIVNELVIELQKLQAENKGDYQVYLQVRGTHEIDVEWGKLEQIKTCSKFKTVDLNAYKE